MTRCGAAVLIVVLAASFVAALPHWHGHNHRGWRSQHGLEHNHQTLLPADSFKDLFPQHHHRRFHTREHRHYLPHYPTRWGHGQTTDEQKTSQSLLSVWPHSSWRHPFPPSGQTLSTDDQKTSFIPQPLLGWQPHSSHHHSHSWNLDLTKDQGQERLPIPRPLLEWPRRRHDHSFYERRHQWPLWTRWNHDQITANEGSQQIHPQINHEDAVNIERIIVKNNKDKIEKKALGEIETLNESPQMIEEQKTKELQQTVKVIKDETTNLDQRSNEEQILRKNEEQGTNKSENSGLSADGTTKDDRETKESHQSIKIKEYTASKNADNIKNLETENNLTTHLLSKCQTINAHGIKIKLNNEFCFWPEETAETDKSADGTTTVCEEKAIIPDVLMPDHKYLITGEFEKRIECRELAPVLDNKDHDVSEQTDGIQNKYKHDDNGFANTNDKNSENVKVQYDNTEAKISDATLEMPAAIAAANNYEAEEKQSDKHHVVLLQRAGETGLYIPQNTYEIPKDKEGNSDYVIKSNLDSLQHNGAQVEKAKDIENLMKKMLNTFVESFSDSAKHEVVQEKNIPTSTNNIIRKVGPEEFVKTFSDIPTDDQEETTETSTNNDKVMKFNDEQIESISNSPKLEDVPEETTETTEKKDDNERKTNEPTDRKTQISAFNDKMKEDTDKPIETLSEIPKFADEKELLEIFSNNYETVEQLIDELNESISDSPTHIDEETETIANNDEVKKDSDELIEYNSVSPKHEDVQEGTTEILTKKEDFERNTDEPQGDDFYIRDLFEVIEAS